MLINLNMDHHLTCSVMSSDTSFSSSIAQGIMRATSYMYKPIVSGKIIEQFGRILETIVGYE